MVEVDLIAELSPINPFDYFLEPEAENYPFEYSPSLARDLERYRVVQPAGQLLQRFLNGVPTGTRPTMAFVVDLNRRVRDQIGYVVRLEPGIQSCEETLNRRTGSCRDSAWFLVQVFRHLGLAARFVSGYLIQLASDEVSKDSVDLHALVEV